MFDNFAAVVEPKDVDAGIVLVARPFLMTVKYDKIVLRDRTLERDFLVGKFICHSFEIVDECLLAIRDLRIVLDVSVASILLNRFARFSLVEHHVVKIQGILTVSLGVVAHALLHQLKIDTAKVSCA